MTTENTKSTSLFPQACVPCIISAQLHAGFCRCQQRPTEKKGSESRHAQTKRGREWLPTGSMHLEAVGIAYHVQDNRSGSS